MQPHSQIATSKYHCSAHAPTRPHLECLAAPVVVVVGGGGVAVDMEVSSAASSRRRLRPNASRLNLKLFVRATESAHRVARTTANWTLWKRRAELSFRDQRDGLHSCARARLDRRSPSSRRKAGAHILPVGQLDGVRRGKAALTMARSYLSALI